MRDYKLWRTGYKDLLNHITLGYKLQQVSCRGEFHNSQIL